MVLQGFIQNFEKLAHSGTYFLFQVFIGFVLKQFEYIEVGQFRYVFSITEFC